MKKILAAAISCAFLFMAIPAMAGVVDISGPWIIDFPQGQAIVTLTPSGSPATYSLNGYIPYPNSSGQYGIAGKMLTAPVYVTPGQDITFQITNTAMIQFFMLNVSSGSNGIAWIVPSSGADNHIRGFYNVKAPAHR